MYSSYSKYSYKRKSNEVQVARGRLKDALHDLVANSDEETYEVFQKTPQRGRPRKIKKEVEEVDEPQSKVSGQQQQAHESFIMKLFDRSLDLSKYDDTTALYPICRAWMANSPRSVTIKAFRGERSPSPEFRENDGGDVLEKVRNGEIEEITAMPAPLNTELSRIPSSFTDDENECERKKAELSLKGATKAQLLSSHKQRWKKIREDWQNHTKTFQDQKYELNFQIIDELYKA